MSWHAEIIFSETVNKQGKTIFYRFQIMKKILSEVGPMFPKFTG